MNHRQRVLNALARQGYDRLPVRYMGEPVVTQALMDWLGVADYNALLDRLGVDWRYVQPGYCGPAPRSFPDGSRELTWPDRGWPVPTRYKDVAYSQGVYTEAVWRPFAGISDPAELDRFSFPSADWLDTSQVRANCEKYPEHAIVTGTPGVGDYWDDVETYARNGLVSEQATDLEELRRVSSEGRERPPYAAWGGVFHELFGSKNNKGRQPNQEIHDRVLERTIGAFGHLMGACYQTPMMMSCCTANCTQALYYAWEGIVRREGDGAVINMWLNRRSPWVDVWSHLPHQGMLVLRNKTAKRLSIRQPGWAQRSQIRCQLDGREVVPEWRGNRMVFEGLRGGELITVQAPLASEKVELTMVNIRNPQQSIERYRVEFRGHTALGVELLTLPKARRQAAGEADAARGSGGGVPMLSDEDQLAKNEAGWTGRSLAWYQFFGDEVWPGASDRTWYRIFRREAMRAEQAPLKAAPDYVHPEKLLRWTVT